MAPLSRTIRKKKKPFAYDEIAEITGLPMGTVKSRINRGRTKLQVLLKDIYPFLTQPAPAQGVH